MRRNMHDAYRTEMSLMPILSEMEYVGVRVHPGILNIQKYWQSKFDDGEAFLKLVCDGVKPGTKAWFNAARRKGLINEAKIQYTEKGNPRYGREFLPSLIDDEELRSVLSTRSKLQKALGTYVNVYAESFVKYEGRFHPYFSQTRDYDERGTTTGRMSSNLQQLPRVADKSHDPPNLRSLIWPDANQALIKRDFSGQELRVAAEYAKGSILAEYIKNPKLDVHLMVADLIYQLTGVKLDRSMTKTMNFLKLYGGGAKLLAEKMHIDVDSAKQFFKYYDIAFPEFKTLMDNIESQVKSGTLLRTWGGRLYDVEATSLSKFGKLTDNYYKLGNLLIQGSSADMTTEACIRYYRHPERKGRLMLVVHDELVVTVAEQHVKSEMEILKWAMDEIPGWGVPLSSDGKIGPNFGEMVTYED